jgi:hypothetical protein
LPKKACFGAKEYAFPLSAKQLAQISIPCSLQQKNGGKSQPLAATGFNFYRILSAWNLR